MADYYFRAHHLLCNYCFIGKGYNDEFTQNYSLINADLKANPLKTIKLIGASDNICSKCKYNQGSNCSSENKIKNLDARHSEILGLALNQELTYQYSRELIKQKVTKASFKYMCHDCEWFGLGICYNQLFVNKEQI